MKIYLSLLYSLCLSLVVLAQDPSWSILLHKDVPERTSKIDLPADYTVFQFNDFDQLKTTLSQLVTVGSIEVNSTTIWLPIESEERVQFLLHPAQVLDKELALRYPDIMTFTGHEVGKSDHVIKLTIGDHGLHAYIRRMDAGDLYIAPYNSEDDTYAVFLTKAYSDGAPFVCHLSDQTHGDLHELSQKRTVGTCELRRYRTAIAATGEYTQYHGGTVSGALSAIATSVNNLNAVFEAEVALTLQLVANNDAIIFTNPATDPYTQPMSSSLLNQNQMVINDLIGAANYDIGHLFTTDGGGIAQLLSPCTSNKARAATGINPPEGPRFDIEYVAHEMGHQLGADHTFNNSCGGNRVNTAAYEPGSGSTIMSYAGICSPNVQNGADHYYHGYSLYQMKNFLSTGSGSTCGTVINTTNNPPVASAGLDYTVPRSTPFALTSSGSDINNNPLLYNWEQVDNQIISHPPTSTATEGPVIKSAVPKTSTTREIGIGDENPTWEVLPSVARTLNFVTTVRDYNNSAGYGCVDQDFMEVSISGTQGPFTLISPNGGQTWTQESEQIISWNINGTHLAPVSCSHVDILLSIDGGVTYPYTLALNTPNDGEEEVTLPMVQTEEARVRIRAVDNIFFDESNNDFYIGIPISCTNITSVDVPITISSGSPGVYDSEIILPVDGDIFSINLYNILGTHTWVEDLSFYLITPNNTVYTLLENKCGNSDDFHLNFRLSGGSPLICPLTIGQNLSPEDSFNFLVGTEAFGAWRLRIEDNFTADGGELTSWTLSVCIEDPLPPCDYVHHVFDSGDISTGEYLASSHISASVPLSPGASVIFGAPDINLLSGFEVLLGTEFLGANIPCE